MLPGIVPAKRFLLCLSWHSWHALAPGWSGHRRGLRGEQIVFLLIVDTCARRRVRLGSASFFARIWGVVFPVLF